MNRLRDLMQQLHLLQEQRDTHNERLTECNKEIDAIVQKIAIQLRQESRRVIQEIDLGEIEN